MSSEGELSAFHAAFDRWNEEEHRFLALMAEADHAAQVTDEQHRLSLAAKIETVRRELRESKEFVAAVVAEVDRDG